MQNVLNARIKCKRTMFCHRAQQNIYYSKFSIKLKIGGTKSCVIFILHKTSMHIASLAYILLVAYCTDASKFFVTFFHNKSFFKSLCTVKKHFGASVRIVTNLNKLILLLIKSKLNETAWKTDSLYSQTDEYSNVNKLCDIFFLTCLFTNFCLAFYSKLVFRMQFNNNKNAEELEIMYSYFDHKME